MVLSSSVAIVAEFDMKNLRLSGKVMSNFKIVKKKEQKTQSPSKMTNKSDGSDSSLIKSSLFIPKALLGHKFYRGFSVLGIVVSIFLVYLSVQRLKKDAVSDLPAVQAYFELNVLDSAGHPVAGAKVIHQDKILGVTDSFGEWRRFLTVKPGEAVTLQVKRTAQKQSATKNFLVPLDASKETRLSASIALDAKNWVGEGVGSTEELVVDKAADKAPLPSSSKELNGGQGAWAKAWVRVVANAAGEASTKVLQTSLLPGLKEQLEAAGIILDSQSPWVIELEHINSNKESKALPKGLLAVRSTVRGSSESVSFLVNYTGSRTLTIQKIFENLRTHLNQQYQAFLTPQGWFVRQIAYGTGLWGLKKGDVLQAANGDLVVATGVYRQADKQIFKIGDKERLLCQGKRQCSITNATSPAYPPSKDLTLQTIRLPGFVPGEMEAYTAGYPLVSKGGDLWGYWSNPRTGTFLSVIKGQGIAYRQFLQAASGYEPQVIALSLKQTAAPR